MDDVLQPLGYAPLADVRGRESVAGLYPDEARTGVFVMQFEAGDWFVDTTIDVAARFARYQKAGLDVVRLTFLPLESAALGPTEEATVEQLEAAGARFRRLDHVPPSGPGADFDLVMPPEAQDRWMLTGTDEPAVRRERATPGSPHAERFAELSSMREWPEVAAVLRRYLHQGVPAARKGEGTFWCCTCLPSARDATVFARIDVHQQAVCTVVEDGLPEFSFHLARSEVDLLRVLALPGVRATGHRPGDDQIKLVARGARAAHRLLADPGVAAGIRRLNLRLSRRGLCRFGQHHSFELGDALLTFEPVKTDPDEAFRRALARFDRLVAWDHLDEALVVLVERCAVGGCELSRADLDEVDARLEALLPRLTKGRSRDAICVLLAGAAEARGDDDGAHAWCRRVGTHRGVDPYAAPYAALIAASIAARIARRRGRPAEGVDQLEAALELARGAAAEEERTAVLKRSEKELNLCLGRGARPFGEDVRDALRSALSALARWGAQHGWALLARVCAALVAAIPEAPHREDEPWTWAQIAAACLDLPRVDDDRAHAPFPPLLEVLLTGDFTTHIAGTSHEGRRQNLAAVVDEAPLRLVREPANPFDRNAIKVFHGDAPLGYVPAIDAQHLAPLLDAGEPIVARAVVRETHIDGEVKLRLSRS